MNTYKFTYFNLDKPNRNGHLYTKECIDNAIIEDKEYPLYLENTYDMPDQIPIGKVTVKNNYPEMDGTVTLTGVYVPTIANEHFCMAGIANEYTSSDGIKTITDFTIDHFFLSKSCAFRDCNCVERKNDEN